MSRKRHRGHKSVAREFRGRAIKPDFGQSGVASRIAGVFHDWHGVTAVGVLRPDPTPGIYEALALSPGVLRRSTARSSSRRSWPRMGWLG